MKRFKLSPSLVLAVFLTTLLSCQKELDGPLVSSPSSKKIVLSEAQQWVEQKLPRFQKDIFWDLAEDTHLNGIPILTIPLLASNDGEQVLIRNQGKLMRESIHLQRIIFYPDSKNNIKVSFIKTIQNLNENLKTYTGNLYFIDPETNAPQAIWELKNNDLVGSVSFAQTSAKARTASCDFEIYQMMCNDACTGQIGGADTGADLPPVDSGCCWKLVDCVTGSTPPSSTPNVPIYIPDPFGPNVPGGGWNGGGLAGGSGHGSGFLGLFGSAQILDAETGQASFEIFEMKVVGEDGFSEENDFRLYRNPCEGYRYLIDKARNSHNEREVGAMLTNEGLILEPNSRGIVGSFNHLYQIFQSGSTLKPGYRCRIKGSDKIIYINSIFHSHPRGRPLSQADLDLAKKWPQQSHFVVNNDNGTVSFRQFKSNFPFDLLPNPEYFSISSESEFLYSRGCQ